MYEAISSIVTPVWLMDACTLSSRFRLSMDATRGDSLGFAGVEVAVEVVLDILLWLGVTGKIGILCALSSPPPGDGMAAISGDE